MRFFFDSIFSVLSFINFNFYSKFYLYRLLTIYFSKVFEVWKVYSYSSLVIYCFLRLLLIVTFSIKAEFIFFVFFNGLFVFSFYKLDTSSDVDYYWKFVNIVRGRLVDTLSTPLWVFYPHVETFSDDEGWDFEYTPGRSHNKSFLFLRLVVTGFYSILVYFCYFYLLERWIFLFIYTVICYLCVLYNWLLMLYFISFVVSIMRFFIHGFLPGVPFDFYLRNFCYPSKSVTGKYGLLQFRKGGFHYLYYRILSDHVKHYVADILQSRGFITLENRNNMFLPISQKWIDYLYKFNFLPLYFDGATVEDQNLCDYYSDKFHVKYLFYMLNLLFFFFIVSRLLSV